MSRALATAFVLGWFASAQNLWCQQWSTELQLGQIRAALNPAAAASNSFAAGIRYDDSRTHFRVMGGVPITSSQPVWGAIAGTGRLTLQRKYLLLGVDFTGHAFLARDRIERTQQVPGLLGPSIVPAPDLSGHALAAQVLPVIGVGIERLQLQMRAGVSHYQSDFGNQPRSRVARVGELQLTVAPTRSAAIVPAFKHVITDDSAFSFVATAGVLRSGRASIWGSAGQWLNHGDAGFAWAAGATMRIHRRVTAGTSVRRDSFDPLYLTPLQTSWNVGLQFRFGRTDGANPPVPERYRNGVATVRLPSIHSKTRPRIAGDFNAWKPQPMEWDNGAWEYTVAIAPGVYNYAFVDDRGAWFVPEKHAGRKPDGMGGYVAVLVVQQ